MEMKKIKDARIQKGISQTAMANEIGLSQPGYANIENGETKNIPLLVAVKISKVLGIGFNELYDIDGDSQKIDRLNMECEVLKKRIVELEEQLNDKRQIIDFLTKPSLAPVIAHSIKNEKEGYTPTKLDPDNLDLDAFISEVEEREKFDKNAKEYILKHANEKRSSVD